MVATLRKRKAVDLGESDGSGCVHASRELSMHVKRQRTDPELLSQKRVRGFRSQERAAKVHHKTHREGERTCPVRLRSSLHLIPVHDDFQTGAA